MKQHHRGFIACSCAVALMLVCWIALVAAAASPSVVGRSPVGSEELQLDETLEVAFDSEMDRASVEAAWSIAPSMEGSFRWIDDRHVQFVPETEWQRDTVYKVTIADSARSLAGEPISSGYAFEFRTVGYLDVTQVLPEDGAEGVTVDSPIFVMFNRPVVPLLSLSDPRQADLPDPLVIEPSVPGTGEWVNTSVYVFTPDGPLMGGTVYTATVAGGLTDTTGGLLAEDVRWQFSTVRPQVVRVSPSSNDDLVPIDTTIRITFNMPVSLSSVEDRFVLRKSGILGDLFPSRVPGSLSLDGNTVVFTPETPLAFKQTYVLSLDAGVTAAVGGLGMEEAITSRFETVPLPKILRTSPSNGDPDVYPYTSFVITFNAPIDPDTVLENVAISPEPKPEEIYGYFRTWDNAYVIQFGSGPSQEYEIRIGPDISDPYGNRTNQTMAIRFRTRALDPTAWLHVPGQTGTFSTYGPSRIFVAHRNADSLTLTLYRLSLEQYFEATNDWYRYTPPASAQVRNWSVSVSGDLNAIAYTPVDLLPDAASLEPGIYLIDLEAAGVPWNQWQGRHLLIASPVNLTMKTAEDETLVWACDLSTGDPIPGLILRSYDAGGDALEATVTDRDGLATFAGTDETDWRGVIVAGAYPFVLGSSQWTSGISVWDFGYSSEGRTDERLFVDTDRPIYRPGQTVSFRGVLREEQDVAYSLPRAETVHVTIRDANWDQIYEGEHALDSFGTFSGQIDLADDAAIGTYWIEISTESRSFSQTFDVAAYSPPEFQVSVTPEFDAQVAGQTIRALVQVDYFFGSPVTDQSIEWSVYSESYRFSPPGLGRYSFSDSDDPWICWDCWWLPPAAPTPILEGTGTTDSSGQTVIELTAEDILAALDADRIGSRTLIVEATARGADGQVISGRGSLVIHAADFYVGLATASSIARAGDSTDIDIVTVDWNGERLAAQDLAYQVIRREWKNVFEEDEAGGGRWTWTVEDSEVETGEFRTNGNGAGSFSFIPPDGGTYKVVVGGRDPDGHETRSSLFVWASGPETVSWRRTNDDRITLIPDKTTYAVGETAHILIPSPYSGPTWVLLTVERSGILSRQVLQLATNSTVIDLPIVEEDIPNVYVSVVLFQGQQAALEAAAGGAGTAATKVGYAALTVSTAPKVLHIDMEPSNLSPLPATSLTFNLWTTDAAGDPVSASVAFDMVDKAVLTLRPRTTDAILAAFYGHRGLGVSTSSGLAISIDRLVAEQLEDLETLDKATAPNDVDEGTAYTPTALAGAVAEASVERSSAEGQLPEGLTVRENFQDTAYWNGSIVTDDDGHARVAVELPDNLTTWVVRAVGATTDTDVGESTQDLLVTKPLLVRPVVPRFFVVGDRVRLLANVSNQTDSDLTVEITLAQTGIQLEESSDRTVAVPAGSEVAVEWWGVVEDVEAVDLIVSAVSGDLSDAARPRLTTGADGTLPVYKYTAPDIVGTSGQLDGAGSRTEIISLPSDADVDRSSLTIQLETSLATAMQEGLKYLEHFEYECTEQVISRFLPNVLTYRALAALGIDDPELAERLPDLVAQGVDKLVVRQNADGGWGWWDDDASNPYLSAYAVYALLQAERSGFEIGKNVMSDGLDYLANALVSSKNLTTFVTANRQAWLIYVLAEGDRTSIARSAAETLFEKRILLSDYARAWLALSLQIAGGEDSAIRTLVSELYATAIVSATGVHWEEEHYDWWAMNTDTRSTAVILDALVRLDPDQPMLPNIVRWLMVARTGGIWETTQETAWALISLTDWMVATGEYAPDYAFRASLNDVEIFEGQTDGSPLGSPIRLDVGADALSPGTDNALTVSRGEGSGRLYYTAHLTTYVPVVDIDPLDRGIIVQRQYVSPSCSQDEPCAVLDSVTAGDEIQVRLTIIAPHDLYYVVIEDPFPAGCEAVDTSLATTSLAATQPGLIRNSGQNGWIPWWWWRWYSRVEFRDEKAVLFADSLPAGTYTFQYTLRAVVPGEFGVLPTLAREFYFPEVFGRSGGSSLVIAPSED